MGFSPAHNRLADTASLQELQAPASPSSPSSRQAKAPSPAASAVNSTTSAQTALQLSELAVPAGLASQLHSDLSQGRSQQKVQADETVMLYSSTSLERARMIISSAGMLPSRLGTGLSDVMMSMLTGTDQNTARSLTELDRTLHEKMKESGGSWLRFWGSLKKPSEMNRLELRML